MKIYSHPANIEELKAKFDSSNESYVDLMSSMFDRTELIAMEYLERDRPNGKFKLPDGTIQTREEFKLSTRFVDYGPEDIEWLVMAGVISECREMYFYIVKEPQFRMRMDNMPYVPPMMLSGLYC